MLLELFLKVLACFCIPCVFSGSFRGSFPVRTALTTAQGSVSCAVFAYLTPGILKIPSLLYSVAHQGLWMLWVSFSEVNKSIK